MPSGLLHTLELSFSAFFLFSSIVLPTTTGFPTNGAAILAKGIRATDVYAIANPIMVVITDDIDA